MCFVKLVKKTDLWLFHMGYLCCSDREEGGSSLATELIFILWLPQILHFLLECILQLCFCILLLNVVYFYFFNCHYLWMCNNLIYVILNRFRSVELLGRSNQGAASFPVYCGLFIFIWVVIVPLNLCLFAWFSKSFSPYQPYNTNHYHTKFKPEK
jgi:hypothetical protein